MMLIRVWRLPNLRELQSLIDYGHCEPALPSGHPFTGDPYRSSSTNAAAGGDTWQVSLSWGSVDSDPKTRKGSVWPIRCGQDAPACEVPVALGDMEPLDAPAGEVPVLALQQR